MTDPEPDDSGSVFSAEGFGYRLGRAMKAMGISRRAFAARMAETGASGAGYTTLYRYLMDEVAPPLDFVVSAAHLLGVRFEWLALGAEPMWHEDPDDAAELIHMVIVGEVIRRFQELLGQEVLLSGHAVNAVERLVLADQKFSVVAVFQNDATLDELQSKARARARAAVEAVAAAVNLVPIEWLSPAETGAISYAIEDIANALVRLMRTAGSAATRDILANYMASEAGKGVDGAQEA